MIKTERLLLRLPEDRDVDAWAAMLGDREVSRYLGPPIDSCEAVAAHIRTVRERHGVDGFGLLAVERREDGRVIGRSGFLVWDRTTWTPTTRAAAGADAEIETGWTFVRDCWGRGYATEAGRACLDHAFANLGVKRVVAVIQHENDRSKAVARRLGMLPEQNIRTGQGFDCQLWVIDAERSAPALEQRVAREPGLEVVTSMAGAAALQTRIRPRESRWPRSAGLATATTRRRRGRGRARWLPSAGRR